MLHFHHHFEYLLMVAFRHLKRSSNQNKQFWGNKRYLKLFRNCFIFFQFFSKFFLNFLEKFTKCDCCPQNASELFFLVGKNLLLQVMMMKKLLIEVSSLFGHLKMSENLEESVKMQQKIWNSAKSEYYLSRHPGMYKYKRIIIIQVTLWITDSPLLIPTASSSIVVNFISFYMGQFCSFVSWPICHQCENYLCSKHYETMRVQLRAWNGTMFTNHNNHLVTPQNKLQKSRFWFSVLWKKYSQIFNGIRRVKRENETIKHKTSCYEITFWVLRRVFVAIVTNVD